MCDYKDKCHLHIDTISEASLLQHTLGFQTQNETEWGKKTHNVKTVTTRYFDTCTVINLCFSKQCKCYQTDSANIQAQSTNLTSRWVSCCMKDAACF